jgi:hypothetical protein
LKKEIKAYIDWAQPQLDAGKAETELPLFSTVNLHIFQTYYGGLVRIQKRPNGSMAITSLYPSSSTADRTSRAGWKTRAHYLMNPFSRPLSVLSGTVRTTSREATSTATARQMQMEKLHPARLYGAHTSHQQRTH